MNTSCNQTVNLDNGILGQRFLSFPMAEEHIHSTLRYVELNSVEGKI